MFTTAHTAALLALADLIGRPDLAPSNESNDTGNAESNAEFNRGISDSRSGAVQSTEQAAEEKEQVESVALHGRAPSGGLGIGQLGPDSGVGALADHLPCDLAAALALDTLGLDRSHVPAPRKALVEVLLVELQRYGQFLAPGGRDFLVHALTVALRYE